MNQDYRDESEEELSSLNFVENSPSSPKNDAVSVDKKDTNYSNSIQQDVEQQEVLKSDFDGTLQELIEAAQAEESQLLEKEEEQPDKKLPTSKELSERFGTSFAPFVGRFKEDITYEVTSAVLALEVPASLNDLWGNLERVFMDARLAISEKVVDIIQNPKQAVDVELARVDLYIDNLSNEGGPSVRDLASSKIEDTYWIVNQTQCRDLDENGIVPNPGVGDKWIKLRLYDQKHERELEIGFKAYLQVPMR